MVIDLTALSCSIQLIEYDFRIQRAIDNPSIAVWVKFWLSRDKKDYWQSRSVLSSELKTEWVTQTFSWMRRLDKRLDEQFAAWRLREAAKLGPVRGSAATKRLRKKRETYLRRLGTDGNTRKEREERRQYLSEIRRM